MERPAADGEHPTMGGEPPGDRAAADNERVMDAWTRQLTTAPDIWAVFLQARRRDPHVYVGDVHAPDAEMALVLAKENYTRRDPCVNLWVVRADQIRATSHSAEEMFAPASDKSYRFGGSYREQQKAYRGTWRLSPRPGDE